MLSLDDGSYVSLELDFPTSYQGNEYSIQIDVTFNGLTDSGLYITRLRPGLSEEEKAHFLQQEAFKAFADAVPLILDKRGIKPSNS